MEGVSVVICCYNSAHRLPETLRYLSLQRTTIPWEILVVNNACTDDTDQVAIATWDTYKRDEVELRIIGEENPGLSHARQKGLLNACYNVVILCDDDNYLDATYVENAFEILKNKEIGLAGGISEGMYEVQPPDWFFPFTEYLAIGKQATAEGDITMKPGMLFGAGLVMRRSVFLELKALEFEPLLSDRAKNNLTSGGDTELCLAYRLMGYKLFYSEKLTLYHYMPAFRLTWNYLKKLLRGMGKSSVYYMAYWEHVQPNAPRGKKKFWWWQWLAGVKQFIRKSPGFVVAHWVHREGAHQLLEYQSLCGRLEEIWKVKEHVNAYNNQVDLLVSKIKNKLR